MSPSTTTLTIIVRSQQLLGKNFASIYQPAATENLIITHLRGRKLTMDTERNAVKKETQPKKPENETHSRNKNFARATKHSNLNRLTKEKGIVINDTESPKKLVKASIVVHPNPDEAVRPELRSGVHEEASKVRIDPKILESAKGGQEFKKIQDAEIKVLSFRKKKNKIVSDLMTSLAKRYERLKKIPKELGIHLALPVPAPEQASSQLSGKKGKSWN
ncbi:hypothetical protein Tco_0790243 [Tanacetum coccineum]